MNILPQKRWHVRTRDNIARVRRDEANAKKEAEAAEQRAKLAEQEARTNLLRARARANLTQEQRDEMDRMEKAQAAALPSTMMPASAAHSRHVNLFSDLEAGETTHTANKDAEAEKKKEQEEYEKKIGLLTYLGQDTHELTGEKAWWEQIPEHRNKKVEEKESGDLEEADLKFKGIHDPLNDVRKYLGCPGVQKYMKKQELKVLKQESKEKKSKKRKRKQLSSSASDGEDSSSSDDKKSHHKKRKKNRKHKKASKKGKKKTKKKHDRSQKKRKKRRSSPSSTSSSDDDDDEAAAAYEAKKRASLDKLRIERLEREKRERARETRLLNGDPADLFDDPGKEGDDAKKGQKYSSQFNPGLARQNKLDAKKKYWLE